MKRLVYTTSMKNIITIVLVLLIGSVVGYLAMSHYNDYQKDREAAVASEQAGKDLETAEQVKSLTAERDSANTRVEAIRVQCQKGAEAYASLSASMKRTVEAPDCGDAPE